VFLELIEFVVFAKQRGSIRKKRGQPMTLDKDVMGD
jgi:hypothetical protein